MDFMSDAVFSEWLDPIQVYKGLDPQLLLQRIPLPRRAVHGGGTQRAGALQHCVREDGAGAGEVHGHLRAGQLRQHRHFPLHSSGAALPASLSQALCTRWGFLFPMKIYSLLNCICYLKMTVFGLGLEFSWVCRIRKFHVSTLWTFFLEYWRLLLEFGNSVKAWRLCRYW